MKNLRWLATKFDPGALSPLTVVLDSDPDLRSSQGLALIDDVSRFLAHQRRLLEVRSATQPLGSTAPLEPARLSERLRAVDAGYRADGVGARQLQDGLNEGAAKLRAGDLDRGADRALADRRLGDKSRCRRGESETGVGRPAGQCAGRRPAASRPTRSASERRARSGRTILAT